MKPGDLVRCTYYDLIYNTRVGGRCIGAIAMGEVGMVIDDNMHSHNVKILHPVHGPGFITRAYVEVINEAG